MTRKTNLTRADLSFVKALALAYAADRPDRRIVIEGKSPKVRTAVMARMIEIGAAVQADGYVAATEAGLRAAGR